MMPNGIDVASYQPAEITQLVNYDFVVVKVTQGTGYINPYWRKQIDAALERGKAAFVYHYANGSGVAGEVNFFLQSIGNYVEKVGVALDWETCPGGVNRQFTNPAYAKACLDEVKARTGKTGLIYGSKDSCFNAMDWGAVTSYPCWGAQYGSNNAVYGYEESPWQSARPWGAWGNNVAIHQYTSNLILPGYGGRLDGNKSYLSMTELRALSTGGQHSGVVVPPAAENLDKASLLELVADTQDGKYGNGEDRKRKLGERYEEVQEMINYIYGASADMLATYVLTGKYGNGDLRKRVLGRRYDEVQAAVNAKVKGMKTIAELVQEVRAGKWGNGDERVRRLRLAGYDSAEVQKAVDASYY